VLFHYFECFLAEYESRFEKEYGMFSCRTRGFKCPCNFLARLSLF
jgi:hypothetical protein